MTAKNPLSKSISSKNFVKCLISSSLTINSSLSITSTSTKAIFYSPLKLVSTFLILNTHTSILPSLSFKVAPLMQSSYLGLTTLHMLCKILTNHKTFTFSTWLSRSCQPELKSTRRLIKSSPPAVVLPWPVCNKYLSCTFHRSNRSIIPLPATMSTWYLTSVYKGSLWLTILSIADSWSLETSLTSSETTQWQKERNLFTRQDYTHPTSNHQKVSTFRLPSYRNPKSSLSSTSRHIATVCINLIEVLSQIKVSPNGSKVVTCSLKGTVLRVFSTKNGDKLE